MSSSLTGGSSLLAILLALLIAAGAYLRLTLFPMPIEVAESAFMPRWMEIVVSVLLLLSTALVVGRISIKMGAFRGFTTLPIPIYMVVACGIFASPYALTASSAAFVSALGVMFLFKNYDLFGDKNTIFFAGLLFGVAAIIYSPCVVYMLLLLVAVPLSPLNWRQCVVGLTGWMLPILIASYYSWYAGNDFVDVVRAVYDSLALSENTFPLQPFPVVVTILGAIVVVLLLVGIVLMSANRYAMLAKTRKAMTFEIILLAILLGAIFIPACGITILPSLAIPAATITAFALDKTSNPLSVVLYWCLLAATLLHMFIW